MDSTFCAGDRAVPGLRRFQAGVAVSARLALLAEVGQQPGPPALDGLAERQHRVQVLAEHPAVGQVALGVVDHLALLDHVGQPVGQPGGGRQPVPPGPAGLLVVALDRLGQVEVGDEPDVRLVDAHPERDGGDHHQAVLAQEPGLVLRPDPGVQAGVVRQRGDPLARQPFRRLVDRGAGQAVDDPGVARVLAAQQFEQLLAGLVLRHDPVLDVRPVEAGHEVLGVGQLEPRRRSRRGCGWSRSR